MIWFLLVLYQVKHFVADYPLQNKWMLGKFKPFPECLGPLAAHGAVHGLFTYIIAKGVGSNYALSLALFDFLAHCGIDYLKANPSLGGRFKALTKQEYVAIAKQREEAVKILSESLPGTTSYSASSDIISAADGRFKSNVYFWWALGADQFAHHITHYAIIALILASRS